MLKRKKKRSQRDWDYEIKKLDEETQLKDSWRYIPIGLDTWKLDYRHNYDPTDDLIFLAMKHWKGDTWHLESHVSVDVLVEGERATRQLIQSIQWLDGESIQTATD